jgi:DnaJ-class molecular chaperone
MARKTFAEIAAARKRYDPSTEGFGNPEEWAGAFRARMGFAEAQEVLRSQGETPRTILGVSLKATWEEIKKAYRAAMLANHPDRCAVNGLTMEAAVAMCKKVNAAFSVLAHEFRM